MVDDSTKAEFWETRYRSGETPWDFHGIPKALRSYLRQATPGRVLIPGCGSGYEIEAFRNKAWDTFAIDFCDAAVARARQIVDQGPGCVIPGDFFTHQFGGVRFDVVYERTFLCSLPPMLWSNYVRRMAELIVPGGHLLGFFLYGEEPEPPPFPLTEADASGLFADAFKRVDDRAVADSLPLFHNRERWQQWCRCSS